MKWVVTHSINDTCVSLDSIDAELALRFGTQLSNVECLANVGTDSNLPIAVRTSPVAAHGARLKMA
jgi:hypothetical protein